MNLTELSINRPILIIVLFVVLGILGLFSYTQLRYELLPNIATPFVTITTVYPGASPTEIETGVTRPIEEAVAGADKIKHITSKSLDNISIISIEYLADANSDQALQEAQRRVNEMVSTLPAGVKLPSLGKYSLADVPVLRLAVSSKLAPLDFGRLLNSRIKARLSQLPGVGQVTFVGLPLTEVRVDLNPRQLRTLNLSSLQVVAALQRANLNIPSGSIKDTDADFSVRVVGKTDAVARLKDIVVLTTKSGQEVRLGEVAALSVGAKEIENINRFNGQNTVGLLIRKQSGANNVAVSQTVRAETAKLEAEYKTEGLHFAVAQDGSEFTLAAAEAVNHDLMLAVGLVALVMFVFLHSLRSSLIVMVAIPASLLSTFIFMNLLGFSLNLLTLLALSLVVGILVDDSIVVLESIYHQLGKTRGASDQEKRTAALEGRSSIGFAAVAITLVDVVVFVPLSLAPGIIGDIMREFALVVVISTLFSLLVSFTLTPMIASRFGKLEDLNANTLMARFGRIFERGFTALADEYRHLLAWCLAHRLVTTLIVLTLFVGSLSLPVLGFIGVEFTSPTDKGEANIILQLPEGTKLDQTDAVARRFEQLLRRIPEVRRVFTNVGADPDGLIGVSSQNSIEFSLTFSPREKRKKDLATLTQEAKAQAARLPGVRIRAFPAGILGSDNATPIILYISGTNRTETQQYTRQIAEALRTIPGTADVRASGTTRKPEIRIDTDRRKLARYGLTTEEVGAALRTALAGFDELKIQQNDQAVTLRVRYAEAFRSRTDQLGAMTLTNADGQLIQLSQIATIQETFDPAILERRDRSSSVTVSSQAVGRATGDIGTDIKTALARLKLPPSLTVFYGGDLELQDDSFGKLGLVFGAAILFMYLIMVALYNSWLYPFVVLFSIPVAVVGALLALALTMNSLNIFSILGLIMMLGLVAKNAILLVDRANENREKGMELTAALLESGHSRLRPILMTTLAMVIGMLPIALATGPGAELKTGLAWVLIGGLSSSMFLTLVFVPTVYFDLTRLSNWFAGLFQKKGAITASTTVSRAGIVTLLLGFGLALSASTASAQENPQPLRLSLQQAVETVRRANGEVKIAQLDVQKADARRDEVQRAAWPTLNATGQYQYNIKPPIFFFPAFTVDPATGSFAFDNNRLTPVEAALKNGYSGAVNLTLPVLQPDLRINRQLAQNGQQQANEQLRAIQNRQVAEVKKLYLAALLAQTQQQLVRQSLARADEALRETRNLLRVQLATDADTLRTFVERENQRPELSRLQRTVRQMTGSLVTLLDLPPTTTLMLTDSLTVPLAPKPTLAETDLIGQAMTQRPELRQLALGLEQSRFQTDLEHSRRQPTLSVFGQFSTQAQLNDFRFRNSQWPTTAFLGLQLLVPLYNPANAPKLRQARLAHFQAKQQLIYTKALISNEVTNSRYALDETRERLANQPRTIAAAERSYALIRSRYRQGVAKWSEVGDAELALQRAQANRVQAVYDLLVAQVELDQALGQQVAPGQ